MSNLSNLPHTQELDDRFQELKQQVQKELRRAYWSYVEPIITPMDPDSLEQTYTWMKCFLYFISNIRTDNNCVSTLTENSIILSEPKDKADGLNRWFESGFIQETPMDSENVPIQEHPTMLQINITTPGIEQLLKNLNCWTRSDCTASTQGASLTAILRYSHTKLEMYL